MIRIVATNDSVVIFVRAEFTKHIFTSQKSFGVTSPLLVQSSHFEVTSKVEGYLPAD